MGFEISGRLHWCEVGQIVLLSMGSSFDSTLFIMAIGLKFGSHHKIQLKTYEIIASCFWVVLSWYFMIPEPEKKTHEITAQRWKKNRRVRCVAAPLAARFQRRRSELKHLGWNIVFSASIWTTMLKNNEHFYGKHVFPYGFSILWKNHEQKRYCIKTNPKHAWKLILWAKIRPEKIDMKHIRSQTNLMEILGSSFFFTKGAAKKAPPPGCGPDSTRSPRCGGFEAGPWVTASHAAKKSVQRRHQKWVNQKGQVMDEFMFFDLCTEHTFCLIFVDVVSNECKELAENNNCWSELFPQLQSPTKKEIVPGISTVTTAYCTSQ